jgi:hypothetical protein
MSTLRRTVTKTTTEAELLSLFLAGIESRYYLAELPKLRIACSRSAFSDSAFQWWSVPKLDVKRPSKSKTLQEL